MTPLYVQIALGLWLGAILIWTSAIILTTISNWLRPYVRT